MPRGKWFECVGIFLGDDGSLYGRELHLLS